MLKWLLFSGATAALAALVLFLNAWLQLQTYAGWTRSALISVNVAAQALLLAVWIVVGVRASAATAPAGGAGQEGNKVVLNVTEYLVLPGRAKTVHRMTVAQYDQLEWAQAVAFHVVGALLGASALTAYDTLTPSLVHTVLSLGVLLIHPLSISHLFRAAGRRAPSRPWVPINPFL